MNWTNGRAECTHCGASVRTDEIIAYGAANSCPDVSHGVHVWEVADRSQRMAEGL